MKIRKKYLPILVLCQFFTLLSIHAAPRWPLPPIPEFISPLYSETFDESFSHGETAAQLNYPHAK